MSSIVNPYYGIELEFRVKASGVDLEEWFMRKDRDKTKQEQLRDTVCIIKDIVTGQEATLLATSIYERIYNKVPKDASSFDTMLVYPDTIFDIDLEKPYLEKYATFSLHNYFKSFDDFMSFTRHDMTKFLTTICIVTNKQAKDKNSGEKTALKSAMNDMGKIL